MMRSIRLHRLTLWWFVLSLVLAQALGMAHRAVHLDLQIIGHEHAAAMANEHQHAHDHQHAHEHVHGEDCAPHGWLA
jgi:ABC-type nickel/cobalt efflux system permease component RcnA